MEQIDLQLAYVLMLADKAEEVPEVVQRLLSTPRDDQTVSRETLLKLVAFIFEQAARTAEIAKGQVWDDDTDYIKMADFIAETIRGHKPTMMG